MTDRDKQQTIDDLARAIKRARFKGPTPSPLATTHRFAVVVCQAIVDCGIVKSISLKPGQADDLERRLAANGIISIASEPGPDDR